MQLNYLMDAGGYPDTTIAINLNSVFFHHLPAGVSRLPLNHVRLKIPGWKAVFSQRMSFERVFRPRN